jgi:hypothetical protein
MARHNVRQAHPPAVWSQKRQRLPHPKVTCHVVYIPYQRPPLCHPRDHPRGPIRQPPQQVPPLPQVLPSPVLKPCPALPGHSQTDTPAHAALPAAQRPSKRPLRPVPAPQARVYPRPPPALCRPLLTELLLAAALSLVRAVPARPAGQLPPVLRLCLVKSNRTLDSYL